MMTATIDQNILEMYQSQFGFVPSDDDTSDIHEVASMKEWLAQTNVQGMTSDEMFHAWADWATKQEREIKETLRQLNGGHSVCIKGHKIARLSGNLNIYLVDGTPLSLTTAAYVAAIPVQDAPKNTVPTEINEWTDLDNFDEYEAKEQGWTPELITAALREIQRRELAPNPSLHASDEIIMQSPEWREEDEPLEIRRTRGNAGIEWQGPGYYYSDPERRGLWVRATSLEQLESYTYTMRFGEDDLQ